MNKLVTRGILLAAMVALTSGIQAGAVDQRRARLNAICSALRENETTKHKSPSDDATAAIQEAVALLQDLKDQLNQTDLQGYVSALQYYYDQINGGDNALYRLPLTSYFNNIQTNSLTATDQINTNNLVVSGTITTPNGSFGGPSGSVLSTLTVTGNSNLNNVISTGALTVAGQANLNGGVSGTGPVTFNITGDGPAGFNLIAGANDGMTIGATATGNGQLITGSNALIGGDLLFNLSPSQTGGTALNFHAMGLAESASFGASGLNVGDQVRVDCGQVSFSGDTPPYYGLPFATGGIASVTGVSATEFNLFLNYVPKGQPLFIATVAGTTTVTGATIVSGYQPGAYFAVNLATSNDVDFMIIGIV